MLVGLDARDDAAVYALDADRALVTTVDFFTPIVDDPYSFGAIAAANALSDIYAMGGRPLFALNIVGFPLGRLDASVLAAILRGGQEKAAEAGVAIIGGHSIDDSEPKYGLAAVGFVRLDGIYRKNDARPGDRLVLTKAIGTGIISTAIKRGSAPDAVIETAVASMIKLNGPALDLARGFDMGALTDVTGFGLLGHLHEMAAQSRLKAIVEWEAIPLLPEALRLAQEGCVPGGSQRNLEHVSASTRWPDALTEAQKILLCDAQTSGGLLVSVAPRDAAKLVESLRAGGHAAADIGELVAGKAGAIEVR